MNSTAPLDLCAPSRFVPIAEVRRRFGITARALRHYEELGLIRPHRLGRNYRAFDPATVADIEVIVALRRADLPIPVIGRILGLRGQAETQAEAIRSALQAVIVEKQRQIETVVALLSAFGSGEVGRPIDHPR